MKYKKGDKVRIKSLDWYNENKDEDGIVELSTHVFVPGMSQFCGKVVTIEDVFEDIDDSVVYYMEEIDWDWTNEMIEGLVEEETKFGTASNPIEIKSNANCLTKERVVETKPEFKIGDKITNGKTQLTILTITSNKYIVEDNFGECGTLYFNTQDDWKLVEEENNDCEKCGLIRNSTRCLFMDNCPHNKQKNIIEIPKDWVLKDENNNVINTTKIVLEKKKKEYPKTYKECCEIVKVGKEHTLEGEIIRKNNYKIDLLESFQKLLICRDAYWKIAGEKMGLGKPWEPDYIEESWEQGCPIKYVIYYTGTHITKERKCTPSYILAFPTPETRDAFYENFKSEIETCKELL